MIWNKLRAFQNEGWVQHVKNVTGRMVSIEGAIGCLEVLEEQWVMCSLVWLPQKGSVREPWILRLVDRKPGCPVWQQIHDSLQWWKTGSDTYYIKTTFSVMEILSSFSQLRCRVMTLLVMNLQRYKVYPPRLFGLVISIRSWKELLLYSRKEWFYSQIIQISWLITEDYLDIFSITV